MQLYRPMYTGDANNKIVRIIDLKKEGVYIEHFRKIVSDAYIPKDIYMMLSLNLPSELINMIILCICDTIVIKFNCDDFEFIDPMNDMILRKQPHDINNYYYVYPSYKNDDVYLFFAHYMKVDYAYLNYAGDDVYSIKTVPVLRHIALVPNVNNEPDSDDIIYLEYLKSLYKKVNTIREHMVHIQTLNIYADYRHQFSSDYEIYIIRNIVSISNKLYKISVYNTIDDSIIISKELEFNIIVNDNMLSPIINNKLYLIFVNISKCSVSNKMSLLIINIYNIKTLELIKSVTKNDYTPSLGILDIIWNNNSVKLYNNYTNYTTIVNL
jgi:hypothetical protein